MSPMINPNPYERNGSKKDSAKEELRGAEKISEDSVSTGLSGGFSDALSAEGGSSFKSSVKGLSAKKLKGKGKFSKKKLAPIIFIIGLIGGIGGLVGASQSLMPFALVNRLIEEFNTNGISSVLRSDNILDLQLSSVTGLFSLTKDQISTLKDNGISTVEFSGGKVLVYKASNNNYTPVVGTTQYNNGNNNNSIRSAVAASIGYSNINDPVSPSTALSDRDFKNPYTTASKTWRGGNSGWYDSLADLSEAIHGYSRSRWFAYVASATSATAKSFFKNIAKSAISRDMMSGDVIGGAITESESGSVTGDTSAAASKLDIAGKFISAASTGATLGCAAVEGFMSIQTLMTTTQRLQKINLVSGYMEAVQKVQAGDSENSPMDEYNNRLTTTDSKTGKSAMNSAGMGALFSGMQISADDPSAQSINAEKAVTAVSESQDNKITKLFADIAGSAKGLLKAYTVCNYVKGTVAVVNAAFTVVSVIPILGQAIKGIQLTIKAAAKAVMKGIISAAAPVIAKLIIKAIGKSLLQDMATSWLGEDLGNAIVSGGNTLLSANHQTGGGSPGSAAKVAQFKQEQEIVIAEEAEYQRSIRSPFDINSRYTFLGSLAYSMIPFATSTSVGGVVKNLSALMTNSVVKLLPSASAVAQTEMVNGAKAGDCPTLELVGIQGDAYCNPFYLTDSDTIYGKGDNPDEIISKELSSGNITKNSDGTYSVKDGSELSKYILYCGQRVSSWGIADANIASSLTEKSTGGKILSAIPLIGDAMEIADAAKSEKNLPWTTGGACVASDSNSHWKNNSIHQRFVEDQRVAEGIGAVEENSVTAYLKDYYEKNPLDNSFEGILARYSGMTKEKVIATLDLIEGLTYIANYHPEERFAFGKPEEKEIYFEENNLKETVIATEPKYIIYNDVRNRVFAV